MYLLTAVNTQTISNHSSVHSIRSQVPFKKEKLCKRKVLKCNISDRAVENEGVRSGNASYVLFVQQCIQQRALRMLTGSGTLSVGNTHTHTHKDDDDYNGDDDGDEVLCSNESAEPEPVSGQARAGSSRPQRSPGNSGLRGTLTWNSGSRGSEAVPPRPARLTCDASPGDALHHGLHGGGCSDWDSPCGQTLRLRQWLLGRRPLPATPEMLLEDPFHRAASRPRRPHLSTNWPRPCQSRSPVTYP